MSNKHHDTDMNKNGATRPWDVILNGKVIDTVWYTPGPGVDADYVRRSLINHDNYDPNITVRKGAK